MARHLDASCELHRDELRACNEMQESTGRVQWRFVGSAALALPLSRGLNDLSRVHSERSRATRTRSQPICCVVALVALRWLGC